MNLKVKQLNWVGNIYEKFETVCQEVDAIVGQDAVKYVENRVQNVGDSVKKLYSEVVHELLPLPTLSSPKKLESHSFALKNNVGASAKSVDGVEDNDKNKNGVDENIVKSFTERLQDSSSIDLANDQLAGAPDKHELVNQVSSETYSDSPKVEDSLITQKEIDDDSTETSMVKKENLNASIEETASEIVPLKRNSSDAALCISDSSKVHVCCQCPQRVGQGKESNCGMVSSCRCQSKESNDESCSIESSLEDIHLNDDTKLDEKSEFVTDCELYAVSYRIQKLRSYKKRIQDAFASKKRLAKEYEQLSIWYGDADMEPSKNSPKTSMTFSSRTYANSKNLQGQQASETEWELL